MKKYFDFLRRKVNSRKYSLKSKELTGLAGLNHPHRFFFSCQKKTRALAHIKKKLYLCTIFRSVPYWE